MTQRVTDLPDDSILMSCIYMPICMQARRACTACYTVEQYSAELEQGDILSICLSNCCAAQSSQPEQALLAPLASCGGALQKRQEASWPSGSVLGASVLIGSPD